MPIYTCTIRELTLDIDTKAALAGEMARIHSSINRVPSTSVDVDFHELSVDNVYTGRAGVKTCYGIVGDTLNRIAYVIDRSEIDWVHVRHEKAGAFAAGAEALLTGRLTACADLRALQSTVSMRPIAIALRSS